MAKTSAKERNLKRRKMTKSLANKRAKLKDIISNKKATMEERFMAVLKLAEMPRKAAPTHRGLARQTVHTVGRVEA
jgi:small subunit ribosomal protein S14